MGPGENPGAHRACWCLGADLEAGEARDGELGVGDDLADRELVVARVVLLEQDYARDNKLTISKVVADAKLTVTGFARFKVGA